MIRVGIGLVGREGRYLIRRRPPLPGSPMPGYWEFPGGKCEPGESPEGATRRECEEELGIPIIVGPRRRVTVHQYPHGLVELHYFDCALADPTAEPAPESGFRWVAAQDLPDYQFPEANEPVLRELAGSGRARA
ncbi:MAG: (deoxy)nucleoside triphosphate pyrophosphohydrolase [Isosphaeraceae bacterium]|nr:(deoxy)nucleoside triphosphate pyrophosphohydrolase [Isosphaeraceae bacterium]